MAEIEAIDNNLVEDMTSLLPANLEPEQDY